MRAWPRHNLVSAIDIEDQRGSFAESLLHLSSHYGLRTAMGAEILEQALLDTGDLAERIMAAEDVPRARAVQLTEIVDNERLEVGKALDAFSRRR